MTINTLGSCELLQKKKTPLTCAYNSNINFVGKGCKINTTIFSTLFNCHSLRCLDERINTTNRKNQTILKNASQVIRTISQNKDKQEPMPIHFSCSVM